MQNAKMQKREIDRFINFVIHVFVSAQQARVLNFELCCVPEIQLLKVR